MSDPTHRVETFEGGEEPEPSSESVGSPADEFERLRELLLGKEQRDLQDLIDRFEAWGLTPEEVAEQLPEAIALRSSQDQQLGRALAPTLEAGISESVSRNPQQIAQAIYPILGPAIRKAISETISGFVETLNRAIEHSLSVQGLKWRFEAWRTGVPYGEIVLKHALVYRVEQAFLIHAESGLLLAHTAIDASHSRDPDLVSGMLTAIRDFVGDSFDADRDDGLRTFSVGELTVMVESGPRALLAVVVRGQAPARLFTQLNAALERIHLQLRTQLLEFEGDTEPFEAAEPTLDELLETVVETDRPRRRSLAPRVAWAVAGVLLLAVIVLGIRSSVRWHTALAALRAEPGMTLIEADRGLFGWSFEGLRDPLARDPLLVLEEAGLEPRRVESRWKPYHSFDDEILLVRARRQLDPPPSVDLELAGGKLSTSGSASARWVLWAQRGARGLAGVSELDLTDLRITVPVDLADGAATVSGRRVLFDVGSARLKSESSSVLDGVALELTRLRESAAAVGYDLRVDIVGRTDRSGTEETNRTLSERRATAVLAALLERGVSPSALHARGIGVTEPLAGSDDQEMAKSNRSVSFVVTFSGWNGGSGGGQ